MQPAIRVFSGILFQSTLYCCCKLVANVTGKVVLAGPAEATALGNVLIQLISLGKIQNVSEARKIVADSVVITKYKPI